MLDAIDKSLGAGTCQGCLAKALMIIGMMLQTDAHGKDTVPEFVKDAFKAFVDGSGEMRCH